MLRIVGLQRNAEASEEFLLLQNQGSMRAHLKGHAIVGQEVTDLMMPQAHLFIDDVDVQPGQFVILYSGPGIPRWAKTKDGSMVYYAYMGRKRSVWLSAELPLHVLSTTHSYTERQSYVNLR